MINALDTYVKNLAIGTGKEITATGSTTGKALTSFNDFAIGKFSLDWREVVNYFKKYIDFSTVDYDELEKTYWKLYGWNYILQPYFLGTDLTVTPVYFTVENAKIKYFSPNIIYSSLATTFLRMVSDIDELISDLGYKRLIDEIFKRLPNTINNDTIIGYSAEEYYEESPALNSVDTHTVLCAELDNEYFMNVRTGDITEPFNLGISIHLTGASFSSSSVSEVGWGGYKTMARLEKLA